MIILQNQSDENFALSLIKDYQRNLFLSFFMAYVKRKEEEEKKTYDIVHCYPFSYVYHPHDKYCDRVNL